MVFVWAPVYGSTKFSEWFTMRWTYPTWFRLKYGENLSEMIYPMKNYILYWQSIHMQMLMIGSCCYLFGPINSCIIQPITRIIVLLIWSTGEYKSRRLNVKAIISKWLSVFSSALSVAVHIPFSIALISVLSVTAINGNVHVLSGLLLRKKQKKQSSSQPSKQSSAESSSYKELRKLYDNLQKEHERVGTAFQNQQKQQEELEKELDEATKDAEELANLVRTKSDYQQQITNRRPTVGRQIVTTVEKLVGRQLAVCRPTVGQQSVEVSCSSLLPTSLTCFQCQE